MNQTKSFPTAQAGLALMEFAILVPFLMLLLLGLIELGRFAYISIMVSNAAHAGVAYGAQNLVTANDNASMQTAAKNDDPDPSNIQNLIATASHFCQCSGTGSSPNCLATDCTSPAGNHRLVYVKVITSASFNPIFRWPQLPSSYAVGATAIMRVSQQ